MLCSREWEDEGARGEAGSGLPRVGLLGVKVDFWWSMMRGLWWSSNGVLSVGIAKLGFFVRSSLTIRAVTCTDSGFSTSFCTLYTVDLTGAGCFFLSVGDEAEEPKNEGLPRRVAGRPFGEVSDGGAVAKKDDLRCARLEFDESNAALAVVTGRVPDSRLVFSASALILCEMPDDTLIFLETTVSVLALGGHPPEDLRGNC